MDPDGVLDDVVPEGRGVLEAGVDELQPWVADRVHRPLLSCMEQRSCGDRDCQQHAVPGGPAGPAAVCRTLAGDGGGGHASLAYPVESPVCRRRSEDLNDVQCTL